MEHASRSILFHVERSRKMPASMDFPKRFDVIVVGGGHAGTEAALAAARMGCAHAAADAQHRNAGPDVVQPVDRRHRQGSPRQGSRRARRRDGARHRRGRDPVPHPQLRARARPCARPAPRPTAFSTGRRSAAASRTSRTSRSSSRRSTTSLLDGDRVTGVVTQIGLRFRRRRRRADDRHVPVRADPRRPAATTQAGRAGDPPAISARGAAARARAAGRPAEDRHAAAPRRPHASTSRSWRRSPATHPTPVFSFLGTRATAPAAAAVLDHAHQRAHARHHPRRPRPLADVHRRDRGRRPALLPVDRGQDPPLRRARPATRSSSSPRA